jgi:predicted aminopeptidase
MLWQTPRLPLMRRFAKYLLAGFALAVLAVLTGCADSAYYLQSARGHLALMRAAKPVDDWLGDAHTPPELKARLELAQKIRRFAVTDLALPDNASYTRFADLQRRAVVWNVVAAPEFSLTLKTWCFPVAGCVGYRGYFDEAEAKALGDTLKNEGFEVSVYPVPAYSTLGWMNWAGGDPLLSTFINYAEGELASLIFHELAHQVAYAKDDTVFNESFATAVERLGGVRWLATHASAQARAAFEDNNLRRIQFRALTLATRLVLNEIYQSKEAETRDRQAQTAIKNIAIKIFRTQYEALKAGWIAASTLPPEAAARQFSAYDAWVANANNASFGAQAAYDELVPDFEALFDDVNAANLKKLPNPPNPPNPQQTWQRFYDEVKRLANLPGSERLVELKAHHKTRAPDSNLKVAN